MSEPIAAPPTNQAPPAPTNPAPPPAPKRRRGLVWFWLIFVGALVLALIAAVVVIAPRFLKGTAEGTVVSSSNNAPIANAKISTRARTVKTDASGHFQIQRLPLGSIPVTVAVAGFPPFRVVLQSKALSVTQKKITVPDASLTLTLREAASQPATVAAPTVLVGGATVLPNAAGAYVIQGIPPKSTPIRVSGPDYETTETVMALSAGSNSVQVQLSLTPKATLMRYYHAFDLKDWKADYAYLHPDVAKRESFAAFEKDMQRWGTSTSLVVSDVTMLPRWVSPAGKVYPNVAAITRTLKGKGSSGLYTSTATQHWASVNGVWLRVDV